MGPQTPHQQIRINVDGRSLAQQECRQLRITKYVHCSETSSKNASNVISCIASESLRLRSPMRERVQMKDVGSCAWLLQWQRSTRIGVVFFVVVTSSYSSRLSWNAVILQHNEPSTISINPDLIFADLRAGCLQKGHLWMLLDYADLSRLSASPLSPPTVSSVPWFVYWTEWKIALLAMYKNPY